MFELFSCLGQHRSIKGSGNLVECPRVLQPGFYDKQVESQLGLSNAWKASVIQRNFTTDPRYPTTDAKCTTDWWMKLKCREPIQRTLNPLNKFYPASLVSPPSCSGQLLLTIVSFCDVAQRSQGLCAGAHFSYSAVNCQRGNAGRLKLPDVFVRIACAMIHTGWRELRQWTGPR